MDSVRHIMEAVNREPILEGMKRAKDLYVKTKKMPLSTFTKLVKADPTEKKKYIEWMCLVYIKNHMRLSDIRKFSALAVFDKLLQRNIIPVDKRDIGRYETIEQVDDTIRHFEEVQTTSSLKKGVRTIEDVKKEDIVFQNDFVYIVDPKTEEDSCKYGKGSRWCTAALGGDRNYFNSYYGRQKTKLYYIIPFEPFPQDPNTLTPEMLSYMERLGSISKEEYAGQVYNKVAVAVTLSSSKTYFDFFDRQMPEDEVTALLSHWQVPTE